MLSTWIKQHWIMVLASIFIILSFGYFFLYLNEKGLIPDTLKIVLGLGISGLAFFGTYVFREKKPNLAQIVGGLGISLFYLTVVYAGLVYQKWDSLSTFMILSIGSFGIVYCSHRFNFRLLSSLSLIGSFTSPFILHITEGQLPLLVLYLIVANGFFFWISEQKNWIELRPLSFVQTWVLYTSYYFIYDPQSWSRPLVYATAAFIFYLVSFFLYYRKKQTSTLPFTINLTLFFANTIAYTLWMIVIFHGVVEAWIPTLAVGLLFLVCSFTFGRKEEKTALISSISFAIGLFFVLISSAQMDAGYEYDPMVKTYLWTFVAFIFLFYSKKVKSEILFFISGILWFATTLYWFFTTFTTPIGEWFGVFIPFLNSGGMAWAFLAVFGFYFSRMVLKQKMEEKDIVSKISALLSHLIIGGLLTRQIESAWRPEHYGKVLDGIPLGLAISITLAIYAVTLFIWGMKTRDSLYRWFGSVVVILVAIKTIFFDLAGSETIYKVITLFILGLIFFVVAFINQRWNKKDA